jgi:CHAT domain-containing protein
VSNLTQAIASYAESAKIRRKLGLEKDLSSTLLGLGNAYLTFAQIGKDSEQNLTQAIASYGESATIRRKLGLDKDLSSTLNNLGNAYLTFAEIGKDSEQNLKEAIASYGESATICRKLGLDKDLSSTLNNLGVAYLTFAQIGKDSEQNLNKAIASYGESATICRKLGLDKDLSQTLVNWANAYQTLANIDVDVENNRQEAIKYYRQALQFFKADQDPVNCRKTGKNLGDLAFKQGNWEIALEGYLPAIQSIEQIRTWAMTDEGRQEILEKGFNIYDNTLQCYINLKQYPQALEIVERYRSRHFLELMATPDLYSGGDIPEEIKQKLQQFDDIQRQKNQLNPNFNFNSNLNEDNKSLTFAPRRYERVATSAINEEVELLEAQGQKIYQEIRQYSLVLAQGKQLEPLAYDQIQGLIPNHNTAILDIYTTAEDTFIFIILQDHVILHTCKGKGIEEIQNFIWDNWIIPYVKRENHYQVWRDSMESVLEKLAEKLELNYVVNKYLTDIQELIIIPHLYLHLIPFTALPINLCRGMTSSNSDTKETIEKRHAPTNSDTKETTYLGDKFLIRTLNSCQTLYFCHERKPLENKGLLGIVENTTNDLHFTPYECEKIAQMFENCLRLKGDQADSKTYKEFIKQLQILHSSHHAQSRMDQPLESALILANGEKLTLAQLLFLRLPELEEVFLSCCETGLGLTKITDDLFSLASGFLCAGARAVISSLWSVNDLTTALFSIFYYQSRLQGKTRSEALQIGQQRLRNLTVKELKENYGDEVLKMLDQRLKMADQELRNAKKLKQDETEAKQNYDNIVELKNALKILTESKEEDKKPFNELHYWSGFICSGLS